VSLVRVVLHLATFSVNRKLFFLEISAVLHLVKFSVNAKQLFLEISEISPFTVHSPASHLHLFEPGNGKH
jgi:hypothetical protein